MSDALRASGPQTWQITLSTNDRNLPLELVPANIVSNEIADQLSNLAGNQANPSLINEGIELLKGVVRNDPDSWVRLTLKEGVLTGHLYAFGELLQIERPGVLLRSSTNKVFSNTAALGKFQANSKASTVLFKSPGLAALPVHGLSGSINSDTTLNDTLQPIDYQLFPPESQNPIDKKRNSVAAIIERASTKSVPRAIRIGIVVDSLFDEYHQGDGVARALSIINAVDGIYQQQLGVAIVVDTIRANVNPVTDPMRNRGGRIDEILSNFRLVRLTDEQLSADLTMVHLFTGLRDPDSVIGLGWINTACRTDGYDVSVSTPFTFDTLLTAHEMAHNLGALHDDHPTCTSDRSNIMWPRLSARTTAAFSACSQTAVAPSINASCNLDNVDLAVGLQAAMTTADNQRAVTMRLRNNDLSRTVSNVALLARLPVGSTIIDASPFCLITGTQLRCEMGDIPAGTLSSATALVSLGSGLTEQRAHLALVSGNFADTLTSNNSVSLDIQAAGSTGSSSVVNSVQNDPSSNNGNQLSAQNGGSAGGQQPSAGSFGWIILMLLGLRLVASRLRRLPEQLGSASTFQLRRDTE